MKNVLKASLIIAALDSAAAWGVSLIRPQSATSGKEGNVLIPNLPPGKYTVSANAGIIASERHGVEVNISRTSSVLILLRRRLENNSTAGIDQHRLSLMLTLTQKRRNLNRSGTGVF